ncbi:glycine betaine ABC transporter substrate-binding protein [Fusobacterium ulcerans]|uniref:glycine betaine ABC transporter substrate-binding protein n=1 Tax=Fusobacterium ulcerans TaxID=861 RepID=UPI0034E94DD0
MVKKIIICSISFIIFFIPLSINLNKYFEKDERIITIGTTNFTEVFTLGYIYSELIEKNTDIKVIKRFNLNGADFAFAALKNDEIDIFVEYTGTILANFLKKPIVSDPETVYQTAYDGLLKNFNVLISKPIGFNNTYVMSTTENTARKYKLKNLSDLVNISNILTLGCTSEFIQREDGLLGMEKKLGINFKEVKNLGATVRYQAIANDEVDVIDAFSTDALLKKLSLVPLKDDLGFFPPFYAVNLMKIDLFKKYPELKLLFSKLDGLISDEDMRAMNYMVDVEGKDPKDVAHEFLLKNNLIP